MATCLLIGWFAVVAVNVILNEEVIYNEQYFYDCTTYPRVLSNKVHPCLQTVPDSMIHIASDIKENRTASQLLAAITILILYTVTILPMVRI